LGRGESAKVLGKKREEECTSPSVSTFNPFKSTLASTSTIAEPLKNSLCPTLRILLSSKPVVFTIASTIFGLLRCPLSSVRREAAGKSREMRPVDERTARRSPLFKERKRMEEAVEWEVVKRTWAVARVACPLRARGLS
jgi:hypothetical protein